MLDNIQISQGQASPLGISFSKGQINFALFSSHATAVFLGIFEENKQQPVKEVPLERTGDIWHVAIDGLNSSNLSYAYRCEGPYEEQKGFLYKPQMWLVDPYAKRLTQQRRVPISADAAFDWQDVTPPKIPRQKLIIYEMHIRGFTQHPSSQVSHPGTYQGVIEKIPYLKELGVNAVELMPIYEFDEVLRFKKFHPQTGKELINYWGYNPLHYFVPKQTYGTNDPVVEFKTLVRELHRNGIEVILDVVYNHTGEEQDLNYYVNFRGLDNSVYYQIDEQGHYRNYSGCGNTFNCNHPIVQQLIIHSLRYWIEEMHVDGFRFDLAAVFLRDQSGTPVSKPPILEAFASDPVISKAKLIAEPWDAVGLNQLGTFSQWKWSEWNANYRDAVRRFIKGTENQAAEFAKVISGSKDLYKGSKTPLSSINYITSHDGFSLRDLVTYQQKHNEENAEMNGDGMEQNDSWNCGAEGPTADPLIVELRERQLRNFFLSLFISQGIPMVLMTDEYGHTCRGNNNPYAQDNELNWFLWDELEKNRKIFQYVSALIAFRKEQPLLSRARFLTKKDIEWHGIEPLKPDWGPHAKFVAFVLKGKNPLYIAFNASPNTLTVALPPKIHWRQVLNTAQGWEGHHLCDPKNGLLLSSSLELMAYSSILLQGNT